MEAGDFSTVYSFGNAIPQMLQGILPEKASATNQDADAPKNAEAGFSSRASQLGPSTRNVHILSRAVYLDGLLT